MINASAECEPEWLKAEDIVFKVVTKMYGFMRFPQLLILAQFSELYGVDLKHF